MQSSLGDQPLGQVLWEGRAAKLASLATLIYTVLVFTLFAHNHILGSMWCVLSQCSEIRNLRKHAGGVSLQVEIVAIVCYFLDVLVLTFHATNPVHPKYIITLRRRIVIRVHIVSGIVQMHLGVAIYILLKFFNHPLAVTWLVRALVVWCALFHVTTACFLLRSPFGDVRIMLPAFIFAVGMYCYTLAMLVTSPYVDLESALLGWWMITHVYVFNRVVFGLLVTFNLLAKSRYTIAILLGVALCAPPAMGSSIMFYVFGALVVFNAVYVMLMGNEDESDGVLYSAGGGAQAAVIKEHLVAPEGRVFSKRMQKLNPKDLTKRQISDIVFKRLDYDGSGRLELLDIARLLVAWGVPSDVARDVMSERDFNSDGTVSSAEFFDAFEDVYEFAATIVFGAMAGVTDGVRHGTLIQVVDGKVVLGA